MKKALSIVLGVVMLFALTVPAFAASGKNYYDYKNYICVGDSIAAGCALARDGKPTNFDQTIDDPNKIIADNSYVFRGFDFSVAPNAYHSLVANELGANLLMCARSGLRAVELRYMLDGTYNDYDTDRIWGNTYFDTDGNGFTLADLDAMNKQVGYAEKIKQADLLTLNVGSNDVFSFTMTIVIKQLAKNSSNTAVTAAADYYTTGGDAGTAFVKLVEAYEKMGKAAELMNTLTVTMDKAYKQFTVNYKAVIEKIYELNPDITVVAVGVYNPIEGVSLSSSSSLDISSIVAPVITAINSYIASFKLSCSNYYFADVVGTQTYPMSLDDNYFSEYLIAKVHPTIEGHKFMAEKILSELPEKPLDAPTVKAGNVAATGKVKLSWAAVDGAVSYDVYRSLTKYGLYSKLGSTDSISYTDTTAKTGYTYYYKVRAIAADGEKSDYSAVVSRTCDCAAPVVKAGNNAATGKVTLSWSKVDGAKEYIVYRATSKNGKYTKMYTTTGTTYTNTSAKAGYTYYYKVKAVSSKTTDADSAFSAIVCRTCDCARPTVKVALNANGDPKLTWGSVSGAGSYAVYRATSKNGTYTRLATVKGTSLTNTSAKAGTTYYYKVKAISARTSAANSAFSTVVSIKAK